MIKKQLVKTLYNTIKDFIPIILDPTTNGKSKMSKVKRKAKSKTKSKVKSSIKKKVKKLL